MSFNDVAIAYVTGSASNIHFCYMSKDGIISIMKKNVFCNFFIMYKKLII